MMERKEYFKTSLDCVDSSNYEPSEDEGQDGFGNITQPEGEETDSEPSPSSGCQEYTCSTDCVSNGFCGNDLHYKLFLFLGFC
jgi:hypothetical protein